MNGDQRMVPVELLRFLNGEADLEGVWFGGRPPEHKGQFWWRKYLTPIISGPGVEPVELPPQLVGQAKTMLICEGRDTVPAEVGHWYSPAYVAELLAAPSAPVAPLGVVRPVAPISGVSENTSSYVPEAPVQAVPDGWLEQYDIFVKDYRKYVAGDSSMPFAELRMSLAAFLEECEKISAAPQPPKEIGK